MQDIQIFGQHDDATIAQLQTCLHTPGGRYAVLCADGHKGYSQPVGGVVAYKDKISVSGVGYDIACGNLACKTNLRIDQVMPNLSIIMDRIVAEISFGVGRANATPFDHELFDDPTWKWLDGFRVNHPSKPQLQARVDRQKARSQLGTVGSGNHYVDIFEDEDGFIWVGVHFGSRGLGHTIATAFLWQAGSVDGMDVPPTLLDVNSEAGEMYLEAMHLAGRYAYAGREYVARHVAQNILGGDITEEIHNHHNFAWLEEHHNQSLWVIRKGATPAFPGQKGFVGGSMGDNAVIIEGVESERSKLALYSTVHGAGRVMSRTAAIGRFVKDENGKKQRQPGLVRHDDMMKWMNDKGVVLRGGGLDEAPQAYRRLPDVLEEHAGTIRVLHTLRPIAVTMAGPDITDPYKD